MPAIKPENYMAETMTRSSHTLPKILVVDDDEQILKQVQWAFSDEFQVHTASNRPAAVELFENEKIPVVLLDLGLPPCPREATEGLLALEDFIGRDPLAKIIIVSGNSERHNALRAVEKGAHDIFAKPVDLDELRIVLHRVFKRVALEVESQEEKSLSRYLPIEEITGSSQAMKAVFETIRRVAGADVPVLIQGESGTGKELIANAIHRLGNRKDGPFIAINCAAIPETLIESELFGYEKGSFTGASSQRRGKVEYAHKGTLFLDEIGDLAPELQVKILRFLQEKVIERIGGRTSISVDARIIAATNRDLNASVVENRFREDLYFRLAVVKIALPPLRERGDDVIEIAEQLAAAFVKELKIPPKRFSKAALEAIRRHSWPGNVRELQNRVKRALILADGSWITPQEMELEEPPSKGESGGMKLKAAKEDLERDIIVKAIQQNNGNVSKTARELGISRPTLYYLISRYKL
jgi:two-component system, NtrC family, response regulator